MFTFLKRLFTAIYDATVGGLVRLVKHTQQANVDNEDRQFVGRLVVYTGFVTLACFFPQFALVVGILRIMVAGDVINTIATIYQNTVNAYA